MQEKVALCSVFALSLLDHLSFLCLHIHLWLNFETSYTSYNLAIHTKLPSRWKVRSVFFFFSPEIFVTLHNFLLRFQHLWIKRAPFRIFTESQAVNGKKNMATNHPSFRWCLPQQLTVPLKLYKRKVTIIKYWSLFEVGVDLKWDC